MMFLWTLTYLMVFSGARELFPFRHRFFEFLSQDRGLEELRNAAARIRVLQELLESGLVPDESEWSRIQTFPHPWDQIIGESLHELRSEGAPILPTLERIHRTLLDQVEFTLESKVKSAQALSQAHIALALIPIFSLILYGFLPGIGNAGGAFFLLAVFSTLLSSFAYLWILALAEKARFGKVRFENRSWWVSVQATVERILALISSGRPPDQAWRISIHELFKTQPNLAQMWGAQVWDPFPPISRADHPECERIMILLGIEIRRSIQTSLIEGRGCLDRLESVHKASFEELKTRTRTELNLLPNQCLKPLFLFVLPGVMLLLSGSLWLSFQESGFE
ncbi:MAG: hypothetical protein KGP28_05300 [Bdellovibrionales bacterium]|nr:hypothetical protein [Bdellovibrionales bacterium]